MRKTIGFKVTEEQNNYLEQEAADNGMNMSEYVKARLFDDKFDNLVIRSQTLSTFERDLISCAKKAANFSYLAAKKLASVEEIDEASKSADSLLIEQGYKNKSNK